MRYSFLLCPILLAGCSLNQSIPVTVQHIDPQALQQIREAETANLEAQHAQAQYEVSLVGHQPSGGDPLSETVAQMAVQLNVGLQENRVKRLPIAILPFVQLGSKASGTPTGERLSENFIFQLQQHGYNLIDYRAVSLNTTVKEPLSAANLSSIRNRFRIHFVLTGTYSQHQDGLIVNARVLDTTTRQVLAASQTNIPTVRLEGALPGYNPIKAMDEGMIIENGTRQRVSESE
ncbi:FlgO family outer membrane protein [Amphritea sp. 1_MG-2023]|uniref:FlgO family outer membrane protein n=1 Tax=Amphritea sp. 1_MG-2023 TaxID=3062670 RepID=UPI0026E2A15D|nr:FlgO family outer membrane protein [Amphritea sp. 1_MG-2023]MDO6562598.1 FlgO family outer membrane protein [Amphritea sp. 1_MG-2023]